MLFKYILFVLLLSMQREQVSSSEDPDFLSAVDQENSAGSSTEDGEWDSFQEEPTYRAPRCQRLRSDKDTRRHSSTFYSADNPAPEHWPPRFLSSEPSIEEEVLESVNLFDSEEEEVFIHHPQDSIMAPPDQSPARSLYDELINRYNSWKSDYKFLSEEEFNETEIDEDDSKGVDEGFKKIDELYVQIQRTDPSYATNLPQLNKTREEAFRLKRLFLRNIRKATETNSRNAAFDMGIDTFLEENKVNFAIWKSRATSIEAEMTQFIQDNPEPNTLHLTEMKELSTKLSKLWENLDANVIQSIAKAENFQNATKKSNAKKSIQDKWNPVKSSIDTHLKKAKEYCRKVSTTTVSSASGQHSKQTLERLPLPTFSGKKIDYLRFKQDFQKHVLYESEDQKLLALKTKCLTKDKDKNKVIHVEKLVDCWKVLDTEYGNLNSLVAEVWCKMEGLNAPKTDAEFIRFVEDIERNVASSSHWGTEMKWIAFILL